MMIKTIRRSFDCATISNSLYFSDYTYDFPRAYQMGFQDPATPIMEGIIDLHHDLAFFLVLISIFVTWVLVVTLMNFNWLNRRRFPGTPDFFKVKTYFFKYMFQTHHTVLEIVWTIVPSFILLLIALPSFALLYAMDEVLIPQVTVKAIGHQWYWTYEYNDSVIHYMPIQAHRRLLGILITDETELFNENSRFYEADQMPVEHLDWKINQGMVNDYVETFWKMRQQQRYKDVLVLLREKFDLAHPDIRDFVIEKTAEEKTKKQYFFDTYYQQPFIAGKNFNPDQLKTGEEMKAMTSDPTYKWKFYDLEDWNDWETIALARTGFATKFFLEDPNYKDEKDFDILDHVYPYDQVPYDEYLWFSFQIRFFLKYDSYMVTENDLTWTGESNQERIRQEKCSTGKCGPFRPIKVPHYPVQLPVSTLRLLEVDHRLVLPLRQRVRFLVTSTDVLHSWAVPSLGIKVDACPGRLNQTSIYIKREGIFYGQCSEICGINHAFMPIVVIAVGDEFDKDYFTVDYRKVKPLQVEVESKKQVYNPITDAYETYKLNIPFINPFKGQHFMAYNYTQFLHNYGEVAAARFLTGVRHEPLILEDNQGIILFHKK